MYANIISVLVKIGNLVLCGVTGEIEFNTDFGRTAKLSWDTEFDAPAMMTLLNDASTCGFPRDEYPP